MRSSLLGLLSLAMGCALHPPPLSLTRALAALPSAPLRGDDDLVGLASLDRASLVRRVLARDPARIAAVQRARAALEDADAARSLPAPEAGAQVWNIPWSRPWDLGRAQMIMVELRQPFTTANLRNARAGQYLAEAEGALAEVATREQDLLGQVALAHADLVASHRHHAVHTAHLALVDAMAELLRARLGATTGSLAAVARIEAERAAVLRRIARIDGERLRAGRALNGLLLRPADAPLPPVTAIDALPVAPPLEALVTRALTLRGELRGAEARVRGAVARMAEARAEAREPMVTAGFSAWFDPMSSPGYGLSATTSLPWLWGGGAHRERAAALRASAESLDRDARLAGVRAEVAGAHAEMLTAAGSLETLRREALPAARRAVDAALAAFAAGNAALLEWLDAARTLTDLGDEEADELATLLRAAANLEARVGAPLTPGATP